MTPDAALAHAIDDVYAAFATYERPAILEAAPTRDGAAILRGLSAAPLRQLTGEQIGPYAGWAMTTVGTALDYKHFLPRILEITVREPLWMGTDPMIVAGRLVRAEWRGWPGAEQDAIRRLYRAAWTRARRSHPDEIDAADWLGGLGAIGEDLADVLAAWLSPPTPNAALQVAHLRLAVSLSGDEPLGTWSHVTEAQRQTVQRWLASDDVQAALAAAVVDERDAWVIEKALARRVVH